MISNPKYIPALLMLIVIKIVVGVVGGYLSAVLYKLFFKHKKEQEDHHEHDDEDEHHEEERATHGGCCHHNVSTKSFEWLHPMLHCLKISAFVLVVNVILNCVTHIWIGGDALISFMNKSFWLQPLMSVLVGLIPNCASSVALAELFMGQGLTFGALVAGLCVNAGLGLIILIKQNKNWKENLFIILTLVGLSLIVGYLINLITFLI